MPLRSRSFIALFDCIICCIKLKNGLMCQRSWHSASWGLSGCCLVKGNSGTKVSTLLFGKPHPFPYKEAFSQVFPISQSRTGYKAVISSHECYQQQNPGRHKGLAWLGTDWYQRRTSKTKLTLFQCALPCSFPPSLVPSPRHLLLACMLQHQRDLFSTSPWVEAPKITFTQRLLV